MDKHARLSRSSAGKDEKVAISGRYSLALGGVEPVEQVGNIHRMIVVARSVAHASAATPLPHAPRSARKEKPRSVSCGVLAQGPGDDLLSHARSTLPSARLR
ncbi:MAG: hypothetical protein OZ919_06550, partial [Xanthomonadaceae bacterium]|nr:hypothetical protein [Xanthomonadaceae bacterium]